MVKGIIGGLIGGIIGAVIWAAIAHYTDREFGIVAWGVGVLVGVGTSLFAGNDVSPLTGAAAAVIALGSIAGGKFAVIHALAGQVKTTVHAKVHIGENEAIVGIADQLAEEAESAGKKLDWPKGSSREEASEESEFPAALWADAKARWNAMSPSAQETYKRDYEQHVHAQLDNAIGEVESKAFFESFSFFDLLFALFAVGSAFKLGSGDGGGDD
ncbi:MAG: hypothetical protein KF805_09435 [Phycisphaeraceae bacterium]|nr:hypothetical protein [Phycisphaeraceae bacterium]